MSELRFIAVADEVPELAQEAARKFGFISCATPEELLARADVDLVHIATPPFCTSRPRRKQAEINGGDVVKGVIAWQK